MDQDVMQNVMKFQKRLQLLTLVKRSHTGMKVMKTNMKILIRMPAALRRRHLLPVTAIAQLQKIPAKDKPFRDIGTLMAFPFGLFTSQ